MVFSSFSIIIGGNENYHQLLTINHTYELFNIKIPMKFGQCQIKETELGYDICIQDFGQLTTPGIPKLPHKIISIAIPPNTRFNNISYVVTDSIILPGNYDIRIASNITYEIKEEATNRIENLYLLNYESIYLTNESFPKNIVDFVRISGYRNYDLVDLEIIPFSYNPLSGYLTYYPNITISIECEKLDSSANYIKKFNPKIEMMARSIIYNYEQAQKWYSYSDCFYQGIHDFVIITIDSLNEAIEPLVKWETEKGRTVKVVTISWIESQYDGYDIAEKIRNFLRDKYPSSEWGIEDVLIVGHYDDIPLRKVWQSLSGGEKPETDFYYAELSKSDNESWDADGDHRYGENSDLIDFYAEVNVGRIPWSDPSIVSHICEKSVTYEQNTDPSYKNNILLLAAFVDQRTDGAVYAEYIANTTINPWMSHWLKTRLYDRESTYSMDYILNHLNVVSVWSQGKFAFVAWHAHGSPYGSGNFISVDDCPLLNDDFPAIISAASCSNSDTDHLNIGQAMMRQGAVGFIGANKAAYYCSGWTNPNDGSDQSFKYFFTSAITSGAYTQGDALQYAIKEMYTRGLWTQLKYETFIHSSLWGNPDLGLGPYIDNNAPQKPDRPIGPNQGKIGIEYTFKSTSIDPDEDLIYYCWSWGDNNIEWSEPFNSGEEASVSHIWDQEGDYQIRVKSRDINGAESDWSDPLVVSMPKNHGSNRFKLLEFINLLR
jgi:hypothetical protein